MTQKALLGRTWLRLLGSLRRRPGELETASDRSHERYRRAALSGSTMLLGRVLSAVSSLLTVRLTFHYLGAERYGMWMTISSVVLMLGSADLGLSNGLVNLIADAAGRGDEVAEKTASASALFILSGISALMLVAMCVAYPFLNTARLFNLHSPLAIKESGPALLVFFFCFVLNLPLGAVRGVQTGLQKGFVNNLWWILGTILSLAALLIAIQQHAGLPALILCLTGPPVVSSMLNGLELFVWSHPELMPRARHFSRVAASRLLRTGLMYFLLQLSLTIGMQTDNVVIAQILGPKAVADYAVPARLFNVLVAVAGMFYMTMIPAYTEALAKSDGPWIRKTFFRVAGAGIAANLVLATIAVLVGNRLIALWVGPQIQPSKGLLVALGLICVVTSYVNSASTLLNGLGRFRSQVIFGLLMAVVNLALSIVLVRRFGVTGAALGTVIAMALVQVVPMIVLTRRSLRELTEVTSGVGPYQDN